MQNATDLANTVALTLTGEPLPYTSVPWFWSNPYDLRLQSVGLCSGHDTTVVRGDTASPSFSVDYLIPANNDAASPPLRGTRGGGGAPRSGVTEGASSSTFVCAAAKRA